MNIPQKVKQTIQKYKLASKSDKILVALSGGKDSGVILHVLKELGYNVEGIHINLGMGKYSGACMQVVEELCERLAIKLHVYYAEKETGKKIPKIIRKNPGFNHFSPAFYLAGLFAKPREDMRLLSARVRCGGGTSFPSTRPSR